jgi:hypothetical protein
MAGYQPIQRPDPQLGAYPRRPLAARLRQGLSGEVVCPLCQATATTASYIGLTNKRDQWLCGVGEEEGEAREAGRDR